MAARLSIANFNLALPETGTVYDIGADWSRELGVLGEIALVYGHDLEETPDVENLKALAGRIGLLEEIALGDKRVSDLGLSSTGLMLVRDWVDRSGLLVPVSRMFDTDQRVPKSVDVAVLTGTDRTAMMIRGRRLEELVDEMHIGKVLLVGGEIQLSESDIPNDETGLMTQVDVMRNEIIPRLVMSGLRCVIRERGATDHKSLMALAASMTGDIIGQSGEASVVLVSNIGRWVRNAGWYLRTMRAKSQGEFNIRGNQFGVITDTELSGKKVSEVVAEADMV